MQLPPALPSIEINFVYTTHTISFRKVNYAFACSQQGNKDTVEGLLEPHAQP